MTDIPKMTSEILFNEKLLIEKYMYMDIVKVIGQLF